MSGNCRSEQSLRPCSSRQHFLFELSIPAWAIAEPQEAGW